MGENSDSVRLFATTRSLTVLRWPAALLVVAHHDSESFGIAAPVAYGGYVGVSFFFVLSGFILTWSTPAGFSKPHFWRRRFARIYPAHFVMWLMMWPLVAFISTGDPLGEALSSLLLLQAWVPDGDIYFGWNGPAWSLSCEFFFYAVFPFVVTWMRRLDLVTAWVVSVAAWLMSASLGVAAASSGLELYVYVNPVVRFPEFLVGVTLALTLRYANPLRFEWWVVMMVVGAGCAVAMLILDPYGPRGHVQAVVFWVFPAAIACSVLLERDSVPYARFTARRSLLVLGQLSFAFYLVHDVVVKITRNLGVPAGPIRFALEVGISLVAAFLLYRVVERPMERILSGRA